MSVYFVLIYRHIQFSVYGMLRNWFTPEMSAYFLSIYRHTQFSGNVMFHNLFTRECHVNCAKVFQYIFHEMV